MWLDVWLVGAEAFLRTHWERDLVCKWRNSNRTNNRQGQQACTSSRASVRRCCSLQAVVWTASPDWAMILWWRSPNHQFANNPHVLRSLLSRFLLGLGQGGGGCGRHCTSYMSGLPERVPCAPLLQRLDRRAATSSRIGLLQFRVEVHHCVQVGPRPLGRCSMAPVVGFTTHWTRLARKRC